nr:reverse transcriptase domain-containing protein [Tanacetum cinerariifolium]
ETWDRFKDLLRACPHHGFSELHQLDTFYNALNSKDQDSLNSAAGGKFLDKMPRECLAIIESKSKVHYLRNKPVVAKVSTNTSTSGISPDVAELKDMVKALLLDKKIQNQAHAIVKAVEESCVTCGGTHSYCNCPATHGNVYCDNIQEFVSQASAVNYHQGNTSYRPPMMSNQIRPHGFPPAPAYQAPAPQTQGVSKEDFLAYVKDNDAVMRNMQTQGQNMQNQLTNLTDLLTKFMNFDNASTSSSGTLPSNTIANLISELKAITTRSGVSYDGPQIPPPPSFLLKSESLILNSEPVTSPISEPVIALVSAPKPNPKSSIPYPSRRNDEKNHEKANNQIEKFYRILKDMSFEISFADVLILMPKFALTLKALTGNKEKLSEMARTLLNEHCSAVLLKKLPEKLGDPGKFLIPYDFPKKAECLALADLGASINLMPLFVWNKLSLPDLTPMCMTLELADRLISRPVGVAEYVYVKVGSFHFSTDFIVVDFDVDPRVPLILGRCFLKTERALIDVFEGELTVQVDAFLAIEDDPTSPEVNQSYLDPEGDIPLLEAFLNDDPSLPPPTQGNYLPEVYKEIKIYEAKSDKSSIDEPSEVELKDLPPHLEYAFLEGDDKLPVIIAKYLSMEEKTALITEKTTFTCPYGTFAYCHMPFGPCNAPGTFQRCMMAIFHDMIEKTMEVFMDHFSVFENSFQSCLSYLERMLKRCEDTNLCLNWRRVTLWLRGGIRSFLGHAGFYRRFIKDFSKIGKPMTRLLENDTPFIFSKECVDAFQTLKRKLTEASILIAPDWDMPFELMCNASDFAIGAILGQRQDKHFKPIHYANSKARLLRWVLLLQEFTFKVIDTKGAKNLAADHLSRLENPHQNLLDPKEINESFPLVTLNLVSTRGENRASWSDKLDDALWAFQTAYKTPIGCTPYKLVYEKACHLPIELEHKAYWALKHANFNLKAAGDHKKVQLNELNELRDQA